jgi:hypothetical protein
VETAGVIILDYLIINFPLLVFFVYPNPKGSEENQFTPPGDGVNKLVFKRHFSIKSQIVISIIFDIIDYGSKFC